MNHAPDLLVPTDHRIKLPFPGCFCEIARVFLQRLVLVLRVLIRDAVRSTDSFERLQQAVVGYPDFIE